MLTKGVSAEVQITLRSAGGAGRVHSAPLETFTANKEMGRILIRRGGETIAAGMEISHHFSPFWFGKAYDTMLTSFNLGIVLSIDG